MNIKKSLSALLVFACVITLSPSAFASEELVPPASSQSVEVVYEPMTKNEYIKLAAESAGISYDQALQNHEERAAAILDKYGVPGLPQPRDLEIINSEHMGNGVYNDYVRVSYIYTDFWTGWEIKASVPAWKVRTYYGQTFSEVLDGSATALPHGSGIWRWVDDSGTVTAVITNSEKSLVLSVVGNLGFPIALEGSIGVSAGLAGFAEGTGDLGAGVEAIFRKYVEFDHTETLPQSWD